MAVVLASGTGPAAMAEEPVSVEGPVTDLADVLTDEQEADAEQELAALREETGLQLFVIYVDRFTQDGAEVGGEEWTEATSAASSMGNGDLLLAVAVDQRAYGVGDSGETFDRATIQDVQQQDIEPHLADDDWAGAVTGAVEGFTRVADDGGSGGALDPWPDAQEPTYQDNDGGLGTGFGFPWGFLAIPVVLGVGSSLISSAGRKRRRPSGQVQVPPAAQSVPLQDLHRQAAEALVGMDNAVRSAEEELAFAEAQFGTQRSEQFRRVLGQAKGAAKEAFALRQQLDDSTPEPEDVERSMLGRILELTSTSRRTLDQHTQEFATLRSLQDRAPEFLTELEGRLAEVRGRLPVAEQEVAGLAARYPAQALTTLRQHQTQAAGLLDSADGFIASGRQSLQRDDRASAVAAARAAEESLGQAVTLLDQISRAEESLASASEEMSRRIASITADLADAQRLAAREPVVAQAVQRARQAIEQGQAARTGGDPIRALADLDLAEHDLDTLLEPMRQTESQTSRLREDFSQRVARVGARLRSIDETIATRRGAVSSGARTRISEALRVFDEAQQIGRGDPTAAMGLLTRAEQLGEQALTEAQNDLDRWGGPGGYGGGYPTRGRAGGIDPLSVILGGILLGGGGGGHHHSGGWGGGGFGGGGGGFGGGGFGGGGGSFGGGGGGTFSGGRF